MITSLRTSYLAQPILTHWTGRDFSSSYDAEEASDGGLLNGKLFIDSYPIHQPPRTVSRIVVSRSLFRRFIVAPIDLDREPDRLAFGSVTDDD